MVEKLVGVALVAVCFLFGGFLALMSFFALMDGVGEPHLYALALFGLGLILGGCVLVWKLTHRRPVVRRAPETDDSW